MQGRERFAPIALLLLGLSIGAISAEAIARVVYTRPWHEQLLAAQVTSSIDSTIRRNSWGLRDAEYVTPKPLRTKRILLLGDSFTFGSEVADDSAIFAAIVEQRLNAEHQATGTTIEVLNGGLPGSLTTAWVSLLKDVKGSFQPDVIVIVFFLRDGTRTSSMGGFFGPIGTGIAARNRDSKLYQASYIYRLFRDGRDRNLIATSYTQAISHSYLGSQTQTQEWSVAQANLLEIQSIGSALDARVGLVVFPILVDLSDRYPFQAVCDLLIQFGNAHQLPTLDLLPAFMGRSGPDLWVAPDNQHPNSAAHLVAAEALIPYLKTLLTP
jgi:lysophospholipase L1-like esterase